MIYRVKQFFWGLMAKLREEEKVFVHKYLEDYEEKLFFMLPRNEQVHSVKVAREVIEESVKHGVEDTPLVKAALLHDIGKINSGLNIFSKSLIVILNKFMPRALLRLMRLRAVYVYYHHPEIAIGYLETNDEKLKYYILNHHNYDIKDDKLLRIIQEADSKN
jgi:hypothetical protein